MARIFFVLDPGHRMKKKIMRNSVQFHSLALSVWSDESSSIETSTILVGEKFLA